MYPPLIKQNFGDSDDKLRAASPMTYVKNAVGGPTFLVASVDDDKSKTSREASQALIDAINLAGGTAKPAILAGKSHFTANHELGARATRQA